MKKLHRSLTIISTLLICFIFVPAAFAHPLGNFTVNQYTGLQVSPDKITIDYVMDLAEIPAFQEIELLDANGNRKPDSAEAAGYHAVRCAALQPSLNLSVNGKASALSLTSSSVEFPAGVGGRYSILGVAEIQLEHLYAVVPAFDYQNAFSGDPHWVSLAGAGQMLAQAVRRLLNAPPHGKKRGSWIK